jgi:hypothetical protein
MMFMPDNVDRSLYESIGKITVNFEFLSNRVQMAIWVLLFGDNRTEQRKGQIVTSGHKRNIDLFSCLYRHQFPNQNYEELDRLCGRLSDVEKDRNKLIHSMWFGIGEDTSRMKMTVDRKGFRSTFEMMNPGEVDKIAQEIEQTADEVLNFLQRFLCLKRPAQP